MFRFENFKRFNGVQQWQQRLKTVWCEFKCGKNAIFWIMHLFNPLPIVFSESSISMSINEWNSIWNCQCKTINSHNRDFRKMIKNVNQPKIDSKDRWHFNEAGLWTSFIQFQKKTSIFLNRIAQFGWYAFLNNFSTFFSSSFLPLSILLWKVFPLSISCASFSQPKRKKKKSIWWRQIKNQFYMDVIAVYILRDMIAFVGYLIIRIWMFINVNIEYVYGIGLVTMLVHWFFFFFFILH